MLSKDSPLWDTIWEVQDILSGLTAEERVEFLTALMENYCIHCGSYGQGHCHCQNDE